MKTFFIVFGEPVPQQRAKTRYNPKTKQVLGRYDPKNSKDYKILIYNIAINEFKEPITGPVGMKLRFYMPRPKNLIWKTKPMLPVFHTKTKDVENLAKGVMDALEGLAYLNDGQVARLLAEKYYCAGPGFGETRPRVDIMVYSLEE